MKKLLSLLMIVCICLSVVACGTTPNTTGPGSTENSSKDELFTTPGNTAEVLQYLKNKYGEEFTCDGFTHDGSTFHCSSKSFPLILVHTTDSLIAQGYKESDFMGKYADNGYLVKAEANIHSHYTKYFTELGEYKLYVDIPHEALPMAVTTDLPYETNKNMYPHLFAPNLYVLVDSDMNEAAISRVKMGLEAQRENVTVRIIRMGKGQWNNITLDNLIWNIDNYNVSHYFTTIKGVA